MKHIKSYILLTWMAVSLVGCKVDDLKDDVNDLKNRVALIEEQVKILNDNVEVMAYVLDTQQKTISKVEPSADKSQFTITLSDGYTMTLNVGKAGSIVQPAISVENGCWVVNGLSTGVKAVGENGKDGDGYPEFRVQNGKWQVRFGDGEWTDVTGGDLGTGASLGDQFFESASLSEDGTVFTILRTDGTEYALPVAAALTCEIKDATATFAYDEVKDFDVKISGGEPLAPVYPAGWRAELVKKETPDADGYNYTLTVYAPAGSRSATADNTSEIIVRVNQGTLWAVDKLQVSITSAP